MSKTLAALKAQGIDTDRLQRANADMLNRMDAAHDAKCAGDWYANRRCPQCGAGRYGV